MTNAHDHLERRAAADLLEATPDWVMLAVVMMVIAGWLSWMAIASYRLVMGI